MASRQFTTTTVAEMPSCQFCGITAYADAKIPGRAWAYVCKDHFDRFGCALGLGKGQQLLHMATLPLASANALEDMAFDQWMTAVSIEISRVCGLDAEDIDDWDYRSAFAQGLRPSAAARQALDAAGLSM